MKAKNRRFFSVLVDWLVATVILATVVVGYICIAVILFCRQH